MIFEFEGHKVEPEIVNKEIKKSMHTGRGLEILKITFKTQQRFKKLEFLFSNDKKWKLTNTSYSYTEESPLTRYTWQIEEVEENKIENLIIYVKGLN